MLSSPPPRGLSPASAFGPDQCPSTPAPLAHNHATQMDSQTQLPHFIIFSVLWVFVQALPSVWNTLFLSLFPFWLPLQLADTSQLSRFQLGHPLLQETLLPPSLTQAIAR